MNSIRIRKVTIEDIDCLQKIGRQTFYETFSSTNSEEDMNKYLEESFSLEKLGAELNNEYSEFYFALQGDSVIGYLKVNYGPSQTELKDEDALEIERIYVLNEYLGKRVGQLLYDKALEIARRLKASYVWLGVWENNARATAFYKKNGFIEFDKHAFILGNDKQTDIMMKLEL